MKSNFPIAGPAFLSLAMLVSIGHAEDKPVTLRYKGTKGDRIITQNAAKMQQSQTINGMELTTVIEQKDVSVSTLRQIDKEGNFHVESQPHRLWVKLNLPMQEPYTYDSTKDERQKGTVIAQAMNPVYDRLSTVVMTAVYSPLGKVKKVSGMQEYLADVLKDNAIGAQLIGGGSDELAKLQVTDRLVEFPKKPVKTGDTWDVEFETQLPNIGKFKGKKTYTFEGQDKVGDHATYKITCETEMTIELKTETDGAVVTGTLKADDASSVYQFDPKRGRIIAMKAESQVSGDVSVEAGGNIFSVETDQSQSYELKELDKLPKDEK